MPERASSLPHNRRKNPPMSINLRMRTYGVLRRRRTSRMPAWTDSAAVIPILGVGITWLVSYVTYKWLIACGTGTFTCARSLSLDRFREELFRLDFTSDPVLLQATDIAARLVWHPTAVVFGAVAICATLACGYLFVDSLRDTFGEPFARVWAPVAGSLLLVVSLVTCFAGPDWLFSDILLAPLLRRTLGSGSPFLGIPAVMQHSYRTLAFTASVAVVFTAAASLLVPHKIAAAHGPTRCRAMTEHLANQWRRLSLTLYAGAALLVAAVVYQSTLFAWGGSLVSAVNDTRASITRARVDSLAVATAMLKTSESRLARAAADTSDGGKTRERMAARKDTLQTNVDSITEAIVADSLAITATTRRSDAMMKHVASLTSAAITRGGSLLYSLLLALTYLPGALILMERARELSEVELNGPNDTARTRAEWRANHGIEFAFSTQWGKVLTVLSPLLASGGLSVLFDLFK